MERGMDWEMESANDSQWATDDENVTPEGSSGSSSDSFEESDWSSDASDDSSASEDDAHLVEEEEIFCTSMTFFMSAWVVLTQIDGRSIPGPRLQKVTIRSNFWKLTKRQRLPTADRKTLRCTPDIFDALFKTLEPRYYEIYPRPGKNARYKLDHGLAVLLAYFGNGCGIDGDGIGEAASQLGMSRTTAGRFIKNIEILLVSMTNEVINFPARDDTAAWGELTEGFAQRGGLFPDVACVFDGTIVKTMRPADSQGFYDKSFKPAYNCLFCVDYRMRFRYIGVFTGSNSDQSMWNQSTTLGSNARLICPPGVNWLADSGFKLLPCLIVLYDERGKKKLTREQRCYNYHLSSTRMLVECACGRLKGRFKVLLGVTDRKHHKTNARMITSAAVLHNLLIDVGDTEIFEVSVEEEQELRRMPQLRQALNRSIDRTPFELELATHIRNCYMKRFYSHDYSD